MKSLALLGAVSLAILTSCGDSESNSTNVNETDLVAGEKQQGLESQDSLIENVGSSEKISLSSSSSKVEESYITDERDGQTYKIIKVGAQVWMAENLRFNAVSSSHCGKEFFYTWAVAMDSAGQYSKDGVGCGNYSKLCLPKTPTRGLCPIGWHLPTQNEWNSFFRAVTNYSITANDLSKVGFSANLVGYQRTKNPDNPDLCSINRYGKNAFFWSATEVNNCSAYYVSVTQYGNVYMDRRYEDNDLESDCVKDWGFSVRCVQDSPIDIVTSVEGSFVDSRDGRSYKTVSFGSQTWFAENLNYEIENSFCYGEKNENCTKYGRLYTAGAANVACPEGWHLPSYNEEWLTLISAVGGKDVAGKFLKSNADWNGADNYGFSVLPAGYNHFYIGAGGKTGYSHLTNGAFFWASASYSSWSSPFVNFLSDDSVVAGIEDNESLLSVRCIQNTVFSAKYSSSSVAKLSSSSIRSTVSSSSYENLESFIDERDGQLYKVVAVGNQTWMAENLNYEIENSSCYENDSSNCGKYGRLYTWSAALNACPIGWHLPSLRDWNALILNAGGTSEAGKNLKSKSGWEKNVEGSDSLGFSALPAGFSYRNLFKNMILSYDDMGRFAYFWSSSEFDRDSAFFVFLNVKNEAGMDCYKKENGHSVRCLKDEP